jgi:hypothetical protein
VTQENFLQVFSVETLCGKWKETAFSVARCRSIYIYTTLKFLALQGAPHIYDISRLRVVCGRTPGAQCSWPCPRFCVFIRFCFQFMTSSREQKISPSPGFFFLFVSCASLFWYWTFNVLLYRTSLFCDCNGRLVGVIINRY